MKGILRPSDALKAVEAGVEGIFVSNHGARQLDTVPATIDALPAIVAAVGGRAEVIDNTHCAINVSLFFKNRREDQFGC